MSEPKLFNKDNKFDIKARELLQDILGSVTSSSNEMINDAENCYKFADIIIDKNLILFTNVIPKRIYREILNDLIQRYNFIGTYNTYNFLMKLFYGENAVVRFTTLAPAHLLINVSNVSIRTYEWVDSSGNNIVDSNNNKILFADKILDLSEENLKQLIDNIKPTGYIVDIVINEQ